MEAQPLISGGGSQVGVHVRQQNYAVTFDRQLGAAKAQKGEVADREAKRLAFYIFWNTKGDTDRCPSAPSPAAVAPLAARSACMTALCRQGDRAPGAEALGWSRRACGGFWDRQRRGFDTAAAHGAPAVMARAAPHDPGRPAQICGPDMARLGVASGLTCHPLTTLGGCTLRGLTCRRVWQVVTAKPRRIFQLDLGQHACIAQSFLNSQSVERFGSCSLDRLASVAMMWATRPPSLFQSHVLERGCLFASGRSR